jgi:beta-N-acetylhexosaminidase
MVVAADLEAGAGHVVYGAVPFPEPLAVAATNDPDLAYTLGHAAAREGRYTGIHWTYAHNPNDIRFGDRTFAYDAVLALN